MHQKALILCVGIVLIFSSGCKKNKPPDIPEKPIGPTTLSKNQIGEYTTNSHDPNKDDEIRYIFNWGDGKDDTTTYFANDSIAKALHAWTDTGKYQIKVRAQDQKNAFSKDWSESLEVAIEMNSAPNKPLTPFGPSYGLPNVCYTFKTLVFDPDGDSVSVKFDWGNGRSQNWTEFHASGDTIQDTVTYSDTGALSVRVIAKDIFGNTSNWSESYEFIVGRNRSPETPLKPSGSTTIGRNAVIEYSTRSHDPDIGDEIRYIFDWGDGRIDTTDYFQNDSTAYASHAWADTGKYMVKVKARDEKGATSEWSDELEVTVKMNHPPNIPYPPIGLPYGRPNIQYTFKTIVTDQDGDSVAVKFNWDNGRILHWTHFFESGDTISDTITYTDTGTYSIRVLARDALGDTSVWSDSFRFIVAEGAWSFIPGICGEEFISSPALITTGTSVTHIIVGCDDGYVYCLDSLGNKKWQYPEITMGDAFNSSPAIGPDNTIYIGDEGGKVHAINPDGTPKWATPFTVPRGYEFNSSPAINAAGDIIYIGCENETLYAINTSDGSRAWSFGAQGVISTSPAIASDGVIIFGDESDTGRLYILNTDGTIRHTFLADYQIFSSPAINGNKIYFAASETMFYSIDTNGTLLNTFIPSVRDRIHSSPSIGPTGIIYFGDDYGTLYALNPDSLRPVPGWQSHILDEIRSSVAIGSDNLIYFVGGDDYLYALNNTGQVAWSKKLTCSKSGKQHELKPSPVIGPNGWIYAASSDGVYAFKRNTTLATTPWPMFRHDIRHTGRVGGPKR